MNISDNDDNICVLNGGFPINEDTDYSATITKICEDKEINAIAGNVLTYWGQEESLLAS